MSGSYSSGRFTAVLVKEFIQMRRDRMTFAMMIALPIIQLILFGFAINNDPKNLQTYVEMNDAGPVSRSFLAAMRNSEYFDFQGIVANTEQIDAVLKDGRAAFVISVPEGFERAVLRGDRPSLLVIADATDPAASGNAVAALNQLVSSSLQGMTDAVLQSLAARPPPFSVIVHNRYNPAGVTSYNIVPGLLAIILSMTMVMITAMAIVRESERGTMEALLSTPARPIEVMLGKILPYVVIGYVQTLVFLGMALILFEVPFNGSWQSFLIGVNVFIVVNLALGFLFSTVARSQMQAMQMSFFYILPSILLSGFMFPFSGMPIWAQYIGAAIPTTHFIRIVRKVMLKGGAIAEIIPDLAALLIIMVIITGLAMLRYRQTLD